MTALLVGALTTAAILLGPAPVRRLPSGLPSGGSGAPGRGVRGWFTHASTRCRRAGWVGSAKSRRAARRDALVTVLDALAAGLEVGLTPAAALGEALDGLPRGDLVTGLASLIAAEPATTHDAARSFGGPAVPPTALTFPGTDDASGPPDGAGVPFPEDAEFALLRRAWLLCERLGTPLADSIRTVAALTRAETAVERAVTSAMSEARATVVVLVGLPVLGPALALLVGVDAATLYGSAVSIGSLGLGLCLVIGGVLWMRRLLVGVSRAGEEA